MQEVVTENCGRNVIICCKKYFLCFAAKDVFSSGAVILKYTNKTFILNLKTNRQKLCLFTGVLTGVG